MTEWDAGTYDRASLPQQGWASDVLERLGAQLAPRATVLDVGCGTGRVTERLLELDHVERVLAIDASWAMVVAARERLGERATVWREDVLDLALDQPVDAVFSTAMLHWVRDHDRLWPRLAGALRPGGILEVQCGGHGNIARVREVIEDVAPAFPEIDGWSPWTFATPEDTERRLTAAGFTVARCWLQPQPSSPDDLDGFVRSSILPAHLERLPEDRREAFAAAVVGRLEPPLDYVRLNVSAGLAA